MLYWIFDIFRQKLYLQASWLQNFRRFLDRLELLRAELLPALEVWRRHVALGRQRREVPESRLFRTGSTQPACLPRISIKISNTLSENSEILHHVQ